MLVGLVLSGMFLALLALTRRRTYGLTIAWGIAILSIAVSGSVVSGTIFSHSPLYGHGFS